MIKLFFFKPLAQIAVEFFCRGQIGAKGLFHDDAIMGILAAEFCPAHGIGDDFNKPGSYGKIEHAATPLRPILVELLYFVTQRIVSFRGL